MLKKPIETMVNLLGIVFGGFLSAQKGWCLMAFHGIALKSTLCIASPGTYLSDISAIYCAYQPLFTLGPSFPHDAGL